MENKEKRYNIRDFKTTSKEGRICEGLIIIANELGNIASELKKNK